MTDTSLRIDELLISPSTDDLSAGDFTEMVELRNAILTTAIGDDALACTPAELWSVYHYQEFEPKRIFVARVADRLVGRAVLEWSTSGGTVSSWVSVKVLAEVRHCGIGSALFDLVESLRKLALLRALSAIEAPPELLYTCKCRRKPAHAVGE